MPYGTCTLAGIVLATSLGLSDERYFTTFIR